MPELPEVENIRRELDSVLRGKRIAFAEVARTSVVKNTDAGYFEQVMRSNVIDRFDRRGKYLLGRLASGHTLVVHLGMTGQLYLSDAAEVRKKHTHVIWVLADGEEMRFTDVRRFGGIHLLDTDDVSGISGLHTMGPEPLNESFTVEKFRKLFLKKRSGAIKRWLLDQKFIAGIGNIYADESLFAAGIHPERDIASLSDTEIEMLYDSIQKILKQAIAEGGSSINDYINARGQKGGFQDSHKVYGKKDVPCPHCGSPLSSCKIVGRTTTYCRHCQK
jgi:formamidopyrimidine-DNA glycosylase